MKKSVLYFLFSLMMLSACFKDIDLYDPDKFEPQPGLTCIFYTGSSFQTYIYKTALPTAFSVDNIIRNAQVKIYRDGELVEQAVYFPITDSLGYYALLDSTAQSGHLYRIEVNAIGQTVWAEDSLPSVPDYVIDNVDITEMERHSYDSTNSFVNISDASMRLIIKDVPGVDYYALGLYVNATYQEGDTVVRYRQWLYFKQDNEFGNGNSLFSKINLPFGNQEGATGILLNPTLQTDGNFSFRFNFSGGFETLDSSSVVLHVILMRLSSTLYQFYTSYELYNNSLYNPFVEPVNVRTNVNGGLGIFAGMSIKEDSVQISL